MALCKVSSKRERKEESILFRVIYYYPIFIPMGGDWKEMFQAIQTGDLALVEYHLQMGTDPNYQHPEFMAAPLVESIRFNHLEITKLLLEKGADPHIKEDWGKETALAVAQATNNQAAIRLLQAYTP
ncbi:MAG: ankyrin repeat domain-containing protein [Bacteroidota bacterium]